MTVALLAVRLFLTVALTVNWDDRYSSLSSDVMEGNRKIGVAKVGVPEKWSSLETYRIVHALMDQETDGAAEAIRLEVPVREEYRCIWGVRKNGRVLLFTYWKGQINARSLALSKWKEVVEGISREHPWTLRSEFHKDVEDASPIYVSIRLDGKSKQFAIRGGTSIVDDPNNDYFDPRGKQQMKVVRWIMRLAEADGQ